MWGDIILGIAMSIGEAIFINILEKKEITKNAKLLSKICEKQFDSFADTTLDSNDFYNFIKSDKFVRVIRNFYFSIEDGLPRDTYINNMVKLTSEVCMKAKLHEIRSFYKKIDELFCSELHKVVQRNIQLNAQLALFMQANRVVLQEMSGGFEKFMTYLKSEEKEQYIIGDDVINAYHAICNEEFSTVSFSGISGAETKKNRKLKELYVENQFYLYTKEPKSFISIYRNNQERLINIKNFFDFSKKIIILGGAGFGKTTTLNYLYCNYEDIFKRNALKFKINLKDYVSQIVSNNMQIIDCLCNEFMKKTAHNKLIKYDVKAVLSNYLSDGRCLIIFDALDEISSQDNRDRIRDEVETFCRVYYLNRVIITSREVGYLRNSFDDSFLHLKINLFTDIQIQEYSKKWDKINSNNSDFDLFYESFMHEVRISKCQEIIRNPIILVLALIIFDSERKLPHKRVEFYRKCIDTFLISRETHKQAFVLDDKLKSILGESMLLPKIAHFKFENLIKNLDYKFTKEAFVESIFFALEVSDKLNWNNSVNNFFKYITERAELIVEVDENKYDFAHKTFNEYFLALYFAKNVDFLTLKNLLDGWIGDSNNDELARLVIEVIIDKNDSEQHKQLMDFLFSRIENYCGNVEIAVERKDDQKLSAFISIINNLYKCGMMVPKYHDPYHRLLINYPKLVDIRLRRFPSYETELTECYDIEACFNLFQMRINAEDDINTISKNIEILFYLSSYFFDKNLYIENDFYRNVSDNIIKIVDRGNFRRVRKEVPLNNEQMELIFDYYLNKNYNKVIHSPYVFLMLLKLSLKMDEPQIQYESLFNFDFNENRLFTSYVNPSELLIMTIKSFESPSYFMLLIYTLIKCSKNRMYQLMTYFIKDEKNQTVMKYDTKTEKILTEQYHIIESNCKNLNDIFSKNESVEIFIMRLKDKKVYSDNYLVHYKNLFNLFVNNEQYAFKSSKDK